MQPTCGGLLRTSSDFVLQTRKNMDSLKYRNLEENRTTTIGNANKMAISSVLNSSDVEMPVFNHSHTASFDRIDASAWKYNNVTHVGRTTSREVQRCSGSRRMPSYHSLHHRQLLRRHRRRLTEHTPSFRIQLGNSRGSFGTPGQLSNRLNKKVHSNKAYTREQVDFIRYQKEDCRVSFGNIVPLFRGQFLGTIRESDQCFSSRYYRANIVPRRDQHDRPMLDDKGKVIWDTVKVRSRYTPEGKELSIPYTLVDMYPWRAVDYSWVSDEHKEVARRILRGDDPTDPSGKKEAWRRIIRECEDSHLPIKRA